MTLKRTRNIWFLKVGWRYGRKWKLLENCNYCNIYLCLLGIIDLGLSFLHSIFHTHTHTHIYIYIVYRLWSTDTYTYTDTDTPTQLIIWKNHIMQCNYKCRCRTRHVSDTGTRLIRGVVVSDTGTRLIRGVFMLHSLGGQTKLGYSHSLVFSNRGQTGGQVN